MTRALLLFITAMMLFLTPPPAAVAQVAEQPAAQQEAAPPVKIDRKKLLVQPRNKDGTLQQVSFFEDPVLWAREKQQTFYGKLSATLRQMKGASPVAAAWTLMLLSFGYGVFHAAGPGHGKAVISAWLLATENELKRGVLISFMSAIIQALTAIVMVSVLFLVVASVGSTARNVAGVLETASYGLIALLGGYLIWTALLMLRPAKALRTPAPALAGATVTRQTIALHDFASFEPMKKAGPAPGQVPDHVHGPDCGCGHAHLPAAKDVKGDWSFAKAFSLAFAVGIRPCTGALLVLVFANGLGLYWAGVAATFAMAVGTFITVSVIAAIAVYAKKLAAMMMRGNSRLLDWFGIGLRFAGGGAIAFLGTILFLGSLGSTNAMM
ncbi:nickel/cobalt transporter [Aestuariivirga sp.]|jgi:ABC-type nickel/cobalt efflux system permease component RcnA|uniref:nickel/cobalt transporter n=1 Tax=Aestuariivirga sp. TaxID=2650926 RepID=UPI0037852765